MSEPDQDAKDRAMALIRDAYAGAVGMRTVDLESINEARPAELRYASRNDLEREFWNAAGTVAGFAFHMGLISSAECGDLIREYSAALDALGNA